MITFLRNLSLFFRVLPRFSELIRCFCISRHASQKFFSFDRVSQNCDAVKPPLSH